MAPRILLCTDGSDLALAALHTGVVLLTPDASLEVVTVMDEPDPMLVTGTGMASGVMDANEFQVEMDAASAAGREIIARTQVALGLEGSPGHLLRGQAGPAICQLADETGAAGVVMGSRGRGGLKRAVLGSVSDHVVRHAPCPVLVTGANATDADD